MPTTPNSTLLGQSALFNHLTTIKLALELLERDNLLERQSPLTHKQQALVQLALDATDDVVAELPRS
jgi:hypothetical protein